MATNETVVVKLIVDGGEAERGLAKFDRGMQGAGTAADRAATKIQAAMQAQALGLPVLKETTAAISREERAWQSLASKTDPIAARRIKQERELSRAVATATNAVTGGYASQEAALRTLTALESRHAAELAKVAAANDVVAASQARRGAYNAGQVRQNLLYQGSDIAVSLAGGMPAHMVALQQGSQILGGPGGLNAVLKETGNLARTAVMRFGPIAAVVGAVTGAIAGMTHEINKTSDVTVGFGDTALAVWQVVSGGIYSFIKPAVDAISGWFGTAWDWVVDATKNAGNWIARNVVGSIEYVKTAVSTLPDAFLVAGEAAAQALADAIAGGVNSVIGNLNSLSAGINAMAGSEILGQIDPMAPMKVDFGGAGAQDRYTAAWAGYGNTMAALGERDIMGEFFGAVSQQAIANAKSGLEEVAGAAGNAAKAVKDVAEEGFGKLSEFGQSVTSTLASGFKDLFKGVLTGAKSVGEAVGDLLGKLGDLFLDNAFNMLFKGLFGGITGGAGGGLFSWLGFANGGLVQGPGTSTSDSIPARLSAGEFVVNAAATAKHLDVLQAINGGRVLGFSGGGLVPPGGEAGDELILERKAA